MTRLDCELSRGFGKLDRMQWGFTMWTPNVNAHFTVHKLRHFAIFAGPATILKLIISLKTVWTLKNLRATSVRILDLHEVCRLWKTFRLQVANFGCSSNFKKLRSPRSFCTAKFAVLLFFTRKNVLDLLGENFLIKTFQTLNRLV